MRIAFVLWPISQEGGLATRTAAFVHVARQAGHDADFIRLSYSTHAPNLNGTPRVHATDSGLRVVGKLCSLVDVHLRDTLRVLDGYDVLVFTHACPHITDAQFAVRNWRKVYTATTARKITYFSDAFVQDYYPWIADVADEFEPVAINVSAARHASAFLGKPVRVVRHPFTLDGYTADKERLVVWTSAWRSWKGIGRFVQAVPDIGARVELYGTGRELRAWRKQMPPGWHGALMGSCAPEVVEHAYARAQVSVDLTGQSAKYAGHFNRTHIEPMFFGCVSACLPTVIAQTDVPADCVWLLDKDRVAAGLNTLLSEHALRARIAERAFAWASDYFAPDNVMDDLLSPSLVA